MVATTIKAGVILTRPQGKNDALAKRLEYAGLQVQSLPALHIQPLSPDLASLPKPASYDLVVFVSGHAAQFYLQALAQQGSQAANSWPVSTLAATVGAASARSLEQAGGIPAEQILYPDKHSSQDSESLWQLLVPRLASLKRVLIVRGPRGREWLRNTLQSAGVQTDTLAMYDRSPAQWNTDQAAQLRAMLASPAVMLLTSSESVDAVHQNVCQLGLEQAWLQIRFVVIHDRIARRLQSLFQASGKVESPVVKVCPPDDNSLFQMITQTASL